jgi:mitochondrial enoyl-[acyl-carrier protein] reductase / trans-2-enoyl-CoA reductase
MQRVMVTQVGTPTEGVVVCVVDSVKPKSGEVLIKVHARPIHPADLLILNGRHFIKPEFPYPIGIEGIGQIVKYGDGVASPKVGTWVALPFGGTWSEYITLPAQAVIPLPDGIDLLQGSMLALNPVTALGLLQGMEAGQWVVHNAANSTVGRLITRVAKMKGIRNISVVRRPEVKDDLLKLGADYVLMDGDDLPHQVKECTDGQGADRALDAVSGEASGRLFNSVAEGGELVFYGLLGSNQIILPSAQTIFRTVQMRGYSRLRSLRALSASESDALYSDLQKGFEQGLFHTPILAQFTLDEVHQAIEMSEQARGEGKVILINSDSKGS